MTLNMFECDGIRKGLKGSQDSHFYVNFGK
jgi:hypothetical protein